MTPAQARQLQAENLELRRQIQELQQLQGALAQALHRLREPLAVAVMDTLLTWAQHAQQPENPASAQALTFADRWVTAQRVLEASRAGILPARTMPDDR